MILGLVMLALLQAFLTFHLEALELPETGQRTGRIQRRMRSSMDGGSRLTFVHELKTWFRLLQSRTRYLLSLQSDWTME